MYPKPLAQMAAVGMVCAAGLMTVGCSKKNEGADATMPVPAVAVDFNASRVLTPGLMAEIFPDFELTDPEIVPAPLIFGYGRLDSMDLREPVILRKVGTTWRFVEMPSLNHKDWVYAGAAYERGELWAILDSTTESKDPGLYLFKSKDQGQSWKLFSGLRPPTLQAEFVSFTLDAKGNGRITVHQDDDTDAAPRGLYAYTTGDGGVTWTGPTFSADDLISAETPMTPTLQEVIENLEPDTQSAPTPGARGGVVAPPVRGGPARGRGG